MNAARINTAHVGPDDFVSTIPEDGGDNVADGLDYSAQLVARVHAEAEEATRLPWWFPEAAVFVVVLAIILSAIWPMGVNP